MADSSSILKEFLVSIGFKVDDKGLAKIQTGLKKTEEIAEKFAIGLIAAATATTVFVDKVSSKMEELYWSSVRLRDGAAAIQDFSLRVSKIGGNAAEAKASLEGLASALRTDPAAEGVLHNLGIATRDARGNLRGAVEMVQELARAPMPYWLKAQWAGYFGIDERTLLALQQDGIKTQKIYADLYKKLGISEDEAARQSAEYQNELRDLTATFDVLGVAVIQRVMPVLKDFAKWLENVASDREVIDRLAAVATDLLTIAANAAKLFANLPNEALEWGAIGYFLFGKKAAVVLGALGLVSSLLDKMTPPGHVTEQKVQEYGTKGGVFGHQVSRWMHDNGLSYFLSDDFNKNYEEYKRRKGGSDGSLPSSQGAYSPSAGSISSSEPSKAMAFFQKTGWSAAQAAGIVANLVYESGLKATQTGDSGHAYGIGQWHEDRQAAFAAWAGHDIRQSTLEEQLAFVNQELLKGAEQFAAKMLMGAQNAAQAAFVVSRYYERPDLSAENLPGRLSIANDLMNGTRLTPGAQGSGGVTISQKTDINVNGAGDPSATGREVGRQQDRVNGDMARNFAGAVN